MGLVRRPAAALGVLTGINVLNYLDRYLGAALMVLIIPELRLSDTQGGTLQSVFILVYALASPLMGFLGDRRGRLHLAAAGVAVWSAATFASGLAGHYQALLFARAVVGVGEASYGIVTPSLLSDLYPAGRRGSVMALFYAAIPVGSALGYIVGGEVGSRFGWRAAFFVAGGPGLLLALACLLVHEPERGRFDTPRSPAAAAPSTRELWMRPSFLYNTAAQTVYTFAMGGLATWMPTYFVRERHLSLVASTRLFGICLVVAGLVGTVIGGQLGDRLARRHPDAHFTFSGVSLLASIPFTLLAILSPHPAIFWPSMFVTLLLLFLNYGPLNAAMLNVLPPDLRARGFAVCSLSIHLLGDALSPSLVGAASDAMGLRIPVLASGLLLAIAGVVLLAGRSSLRHDLAVAQS
jgi:MFS family permease